MDQAYAEQYSRFEETHWWFRARRTILRRLLESEISWGSGTNILEIGCGPGLNLYSLYPSDCVLEGIEPDAANAKIATNRGPVPVTVGTLETLVLKPRKQKYDVITMFDVLEHIREDGSALADLKEQLHCDGYLALSVPAYQWLWSDHDVVNQHFRRYTRTRLCGLLEQAGFRVQRATYFNALLFPGIAVARLLGRCFRTSRRELKSDFERGGVGFLNPMLQRVFASEAKWLARHSFPCGVSLFAVARPL